MLLCCKSILFSLGFTITLCDFSFGENSIELLDSKIGITREIYYSLEYFGCFSAWSINRRNPLQPPYDSVHGFDLAYQQDIYACTDNCFKKGNIVAFLRGIECRCAPTQAPYYTGDVVLDNFCDVRCLYGTQSGEEYSCGGNLAYSVYFIQLLAARNKNASEPLTRVPRFHSKADFSFNGESLEICAIEDKACALCDMDVCTQQKLSPYFDYFPRNSPKACAEFCGNDIKYNDFSVGNVITRKATFDAVLLWWKVSNTVKLPICSCNDFVSGGWVSIPGNCTEFCPGAEDYVPCGGISDSGELILASVYNIQKHAVCPIISTFPPPISSTTTATTISTTTTTSTTITTTKVTSPISITTTTTSTPTTPDITSDYTLSTVMTAVSEEDTEVILTSPSTMSTVSEEDTELILTSPSTMSTVSEEDTELILTSPSTMSTVSEEDTELILTSSSTMSTVSKEDTEPTLTSSTTTSTVSEKDIEPTMTSSSTASTNSTSTMTCSPYNCEETSTPTIPPSSSCTTTCSKRDRYGKEWEGTCNTISERHCSNFIPESEGIASWFCGENGFFETRNPNYSECRSTWVKDMRERVGHIDNPETAEEISHELVMGCNHSLSKESMDKYFGHEIEDLSNLTSQMVKHVGLHLSPTHKQFEDLVTKAVEMNACLIKHHEPWKDLTMPQKAVLSGQLTNLTEDILFYLTDFVKHPNYNRIFTPIEQFTAVAKTLHKDSFHSQVPSIFPPKADPCQESCIKLPPGWTDQVNDTKIGIAMLSIHPGILADIMDDHDKYVVNGKNNKMLNGRLISLSVTSSTPNSFMRTIFKVDGVRSKSLKFEGKGVEIGFQHVAEAWGEQAYDIPRKLHPGEKRKVAKGGAQCVFWDPKILKWSRKGCKLIKTTRTETICECSHLTSFAVIMDVHRYVGKNAGLEILTMILCPLSEMALAVNILILSVVKVGLYKIRITICKHLSFCLFLGNGMILIALDKHYFYMSDGVCMGAAMLAHYIFLCAFMWMLLEGVYLCRRTVFVFENGKSYMKQFGILAYGAPVVIIAITASIAHFNKTVAYAGETYCWLIGNYIWAFMGPVVVVITTNLVVLFIALKTAYQLQHQGCRDKSSVGGIKEKLSFYRGCFSLTVIMGITWTVGFLTLIEGPVKLGAAYLFTILNASQGFFIFLFTCRTYLSYVKLYTRRKLSPLFPFLLNPNRGSMRKPHIISRGKLEFSPE